MCTAGGQQAGRGFVWRRSVLYNKSYIKEKSRTTEVYIEVYESQQQQQQDCGGKAVIIIHF